MMKLFRILTLLGLLANGIIHGQQEWGYGQFAMNLYDINLAYAGQHETTSLGIRHRQQWMGLDGGPKSNYVSAHLPLAQNKMGVGVRILDETIGARRNSSMIGSVSYRLRLKSGTLNFALGGGASRLGIDWNKVSLKDAEDPQTLGWQQAQWAPVVHAALFYSRKNAYVGVEANQLTASNYGPSNYHQVAHIKAVGGFHQKVRTSDQLQLATLAKYAQGGQYQMEFNLMYLKNNKFGLGAGYRMKYGAMILAQVHFSEFLRLGLNYDFSTQATQQAYDGSFEVFLGCTLNKGNNKSIRYL